VITIEKKTINELLVCMSIVRKRINDLSEIRKEVSKKERRFFGNEETSVIEPQYDVKAVDKKITDLQNFLYEADSKIKQSNAKTKVDIEVDVKVLLEPIK